MRPKLQLLLVFITCSTLVYFVGQLAPSYKVIARTAFTDGLARRFEPLLKSDLTGDPPSVCYYEVLPEKKGKLAVLYRFSWPDETHPLRWADVPYRLFRKLWFGSVEDIEFVWVELNLEAGKPARIAFESPIPGKVFTGHQPRVLNPDEYRLEGEHPVLRVASWNHIFDAGVGGQGSGVGVTATPAPLMQLDDDLFLKLRVGRRSQPPVDLLDTSPP